MRNFIHWWFRTGCHRVSMFVCGFGMSYMLYTVHISPPMTAFKLLILLTAMILFGGSLAILVYLATAVIYYIFYILGI